MKCFAHLLVFATVVAFCGSSSDAQYSGKVFRVGVLALGSAEDMQNRLAIVREPLRDLGYEEGKNLVVESRFANSAYDQLPVLASELAGLKIDVFLVAGEPALLAAKDKGENIPIVVVSCDPLEKLLGSLRRPGGNATGFTCVSSDLVGKRFGLLRSLLPRMHRVAMLYNQRDNHELEFRDAEAAAQSLEISLVRFPVVSSTDFEPAFKMMKEKKCDALYIFASAFAQGHWNRLAQLALDYRLPRCTAFANSWTAAAFYRTEPAYRKLTDAQPHSLTKFSRDRGRRICRSSSQRGSSWSLTRKQPRRLALSCRPRSSLSQTR
jgi:putative ABC transport system substrate-binding protein